MKCTKIRALLSAYADRELSGVEMFLVRQHLHDCTACRAEETAMRDVKHALGAMHVVEPSSDFEARLTLSVMSRTPSPTAVSISHDRSTLYAVVTFAAAAAAALLVFGNHGNARTAGSVVPVSSSQQGSMTFMAPVQNVNMSLQRDRAFMNSTDPLTGPQLGLAASYGSR